jgi:ADP-ribose pyrophosphatase
MIAYRAKNFQIKVKKVRLPDGGSMDFASLIQQPGTNIIPLIDKDTILLNYQYRPAVKKWLYQLAGGIIEKDETPLQNAHKELEEELGYKATKMKLMAKFYTAPHVSNEFQYVFIATGLKKTKAHLEKGEMIKPRRVKIRDAIRMVHGGKITDSSTIIGLLLLKDYLTA